MDILRYTAELSGLPPSAATIGFFDGVHLGHRYLIQQVVEAAHKRGESSLVITFDRHPRTVVQPSYVPSMLTTLDDKLALLSQTAIDRVVVLPFDHEMAQLTAREFMDEVLRRLNVRLLIIGYDHRFGRRTLPHGDAPILEEGFDDYVAYGRDLNIAVTRMCEAPFSVEGRAVSSSRIRSYLSVGDMVHVRECLSRPYTISGSVTGGHQQGRKIGFPTANLSPATVATLIPATGVYGVEVQIDHHPTIYQGMMNIGTRPTFDGHHQTLEVNLFDFTGNLYGHTLTVAFILRIRGEQRFSSPEALAAQLSRDKQTIITLLQKQQAER